MALSKTTITLPDGTAATINYPSELDPELVNFALTIFLGGLVAVAKNTSTEVKRDFLIRYVASLANDADTALRSTQLANKSESTNHKQIVEDLLKSLH